MSFTADDVDLLVAELGAALTHSQFAAFETAARAALDGLACSGPGAAYRVLREVQRHYFDPPLDTYAAHEGARHYRPTKLTSLPPIGRPDRAEDAQLRNRFKRAG
jgi:hypothetical protein